MNGPSWNDSSLLIPAEVVTNFVYCEYKHVVINTVYEVKGENISCFQLNSEVFELL